MIVDELAYQIRQTMGLVPTAEQESAIDVFCRFMIQVFRMFVKKSYLIQLKFQMMQTHSFLILFKECSKKTKQKEFR